MKTIIILITLLMIAVPATGNMDLLSTYDRNGDGIIDADERITLDIDIESGRLTLEEGFLGDLLAEDGSIILSPETRMHMTTGYHDREQICDITVAKKVIEPEVEFMPVPGSEITPVPEEPVTERFNGIGMILGMSIGFFVCMILLTIYTATKDK